MKSFKRICEIVYTAGVRNPKRIARELMTKDHDWHDVPDSGFRQRHYDSYEDYLKHQETKITTVLDTWLPEYDKEYFELLSDRLNRHDYVKPKSTVLCLAARIGTEVKVYIDKGCFAIGIDLNPGPKNHYVVHGDFHKLQYADESVGIVFTNSLDHVFDLQKVLKEVKRVLIPGGNFILEIVKGTEEGRDGADAYDAYHWEKAEEVMTIIENEGFSVLHKSEFEKPWPGWHVVFQKK